jgi:hypothetical protein
VDALPDGAVLRADRGDRRRLDEALTRLALIHDRFSIF